MSATEYFKARVFFADLLLPLKRANMRRNVRYLNCDRSSATYWKSIASRTGGLERMPIPSCGAAGLIGRLGLYWEAQSDSDLPRLIPHVLALREEFSGYLQAKGDGEIQTEFVYPLF